MTRSITIQAETIKAALEEALELLQLTKDDVHIHVERPASTSMLGFKKVSAIVTVREREIKAKPIEETPAGARVLNERLEVRFSKQSYPIIIPSTGVELVVNGKRVTERTVIGAADSLECTAVHEDIASTYRLELDKEKMNATVVVTPGKKIIRSLRDQSWKPVLSIEVNEQVAVHNELATNQLLEELYSMGIGENLSMESVRRAVTTLEDSKIVVAKGIPSVKSQDAYLDIHLKFKKEEVDCESPIDFREHNFIPTVKTGELIATHIPAVQGVSGRNVLGEVYKVKPAKDIIVRPGAGVYQVLHKLYARIDGRPVIEWRGKVVKVYVNREYRHATDVNLESGNIHFDGDVWIGGSVHPSMFIAASGMITIMKNCTKSSIRGTKSVFVKGSIFSSTVTVGIQEKVIIILVKNLSEILDYLRKIESALVQVFALRGEDPQEIAPFLLKQAIHLLLERKYGDFTEVNKEFIQIVQNHTKRLDKEWLTLATRLYELFVDPLREEQTSFLALRHLIGEAERLLELYSEDTTPESVLQAEFALNSILYSNGNIHIRSKGVYNCSVTALRDITIKGVCRGGEVIAGRHVQLDETGSSAGIRTFIQTDETGSIAIGKVHAGTIIQIGSNRHEFLDSRQQVTAKLNEEGLLSIR